MSLLTDTQNCCREAWNTFQRSPSEMIVNPQQHQELWEDCGMLGPAVVGVQMINPVNNDIFPVRVDPNWTGPPGLYLNPGLTTPYPNMVNPYDLQAPTRLMWDFRRR